MPPHGLAPFTIAMLLAAPAAAGSGDSGRYDFVPVREGALRLDRETGRVSLCAGPAGSRSCAAVRDLPASARFQPAVAQPDRTTRAAPLQPLSRLADEAMLRLIAGVRRVRRGWGAPPA